MSDNEKKVTLPDKVSDYLATVAKLSVAGRSLTVVLDTARQLKGADLNHDGVISGPQETAELLRLSYTDRTTPEMAWANDFVRSMHASSCNRAVTSQEERSSATYDVSGLKEQYQLMLDAVKMEGKINDAFLRRALSTHIGGVIGDLQGAYQEGVMNEEQLRFAQEIVLRTSSKTVSDQGSIINQNLAKVQEAYKDTPQIGELTPLPVEVSCKSITGKGFGADL